MSSLPESTPAGVNRGEPIPVRSRLANRFYEPIVLLLSLNMAWINSQNHKTPESSSDMTNSSEAAFHCFVNKLSQLCHNERFGNTITACAILKFPDRIQYRFASNQQRKENLIYAENYVTEILKFLGRESESEIHDQISHLLQISLSFTRPRIETYIRSLGEHGAICSRSCIREGTDESQAILEKLQELHELSSFSEKSGLDNFTFSKHCETLINAIDRIYQSETSELIRQKTNEGRMTASQHWCEFRHAAGRLLSYLQAVKVLVSTRKQWPELFEDFEVKFISSSMPAKCPLRKRKMARELSAEQIIGRMTSDPEIMQNYQARAQELQNLGLDENIKRLAERKTFRPIVHAEVLLLESLEMDGGTHPSRFFGGYNYIGCSKPTCRLCHYYFLFHGSGVEVRQAHRNLYANWRMPDVYWVQGPTAIKKRENLMNKIISKVREDVFRTIAEKVPERKTHDSNTEPTYPIKDIGDLATQFGDLCLNHLPNEGMLGYSSPKICSVAGDLSEADSSDKGGGVKL